MTAKTPAKTETKPTLNVDRSGILQRKCDCGKSAGLTGQCSECQSKQFNKQHGSIVQTVSAPVLHELIQPKLRVGEPGDRYEQEADRVADQVMRMPKPSIQRQMEPGEDEEEGMVQRKAITNSLTTPAPLRSAMETSFDTNFSNVRIHPNSLHASAMEALACTQGNDIYFAPGQFQPNTLSGQKLIGHEFAHVVQQRQGRVVATGEHNGQALNTDSVLEQEADDFGEKAAAQMKLADLAKIEAEPAETEVATFTSPAQLLEDPNNPVLDAYKGKSINRIGHVSAPVAQYETARTSGVNVRAKPNGALPSIAKVIYDTEVQVQALDNTETFYFIIAKTGKVGWINKDYVALGRPDVGSRLHHITESNLTTILKNQYVNKGLWKLSSGNDYTTLAAAVVVANEGREGVFVDWAKAQKYKDENTAKRVLDPWMIDNFAIYHGSTIRKGHNIWLPSPNFVQMLQRTGGIGSRPGWINDAVEIGKGIAGFLEGIVSGIFGSLWDTLTGLWDLGKSIVSTIRSVLDGSLFASIESIYDTVVNMTWEDFKQLVNDVITMGQNAFNNFADQWKHANAYKKWHFRGYTVGAIALEVVLAIFTGGATLGAKVLAKIGKYFPKLMRILNKLLSVADDLHFRRRKNKGDADPSKPDKDRDNHDRDKDDQDMSNTDRAWEQARIMAAMITEGHDAKDTPVAELIPLLNTTIATKFKGVNGYKAILKRSPNTYKIIQRARRDKVNGHYTEKQEATTDVQLGSLLGSGGNKNVYAVEGQEGVAIGVLKKGKPATAIDEEIKLLEELKSQGLSTVEVLGKTTHSGQPAILMKRYALGSKEVVRLEKGTIRTVGQSELLNERSVEDLLKIRSIMESKSVKVDDLQFLVGKDGRIVIADPLNVTVGETPSKNNLRMIKLLIDASKKISSKRFINMSNNKFKEDVPSAQIELLTQLKHYRISKLVRYSWLTPEEASKEWGIPQLSVFRLTAGPLLITLESNLVLGFSSLPEKASVTLWIEETEDGERAEEASILNDEELYSIDSCDPVYSEQSICKLLNKYVTSIKILKREPENILLAQVPCEAGLLIKFDDDTELVLSHGLHDNSDDFAIIFKQEVLRKFSSNLQEVQV